MSVLVVNSQKKLCLVYDSHLMMLNFILAHPDCTYEELCSHTGIPAKTAYVYASQLDKLQLIYRTPSQDENKQLMLLSLRPGVVLHVPLLRPKRN